jgi:hypothetical protein
MFKLNEINYISLFFILSICAIGYQVYNMYKLGYIIINVNILHNQPTHTNGG